MDHSGSKTRSVGQILEKPFEHSRGHSFGPIFIGNWSKLYLDHRGSKTRSVGQIMEKPCEHSRGLSLGPKFIKLSRD